MQNVPSASDGSWLAYATPAASPRADVLELRYGPDSSPRPTDMLCRSRICYDLDSRAAQCVGSPRSDFPALPEGGTGPQGALTLPADAFDLIIMNGVFDREPAVNGGGADIDRGALLSLTYRALRSGGFVAIAGPNLLHPRYFGLRVRRRLAGLLRRPKGAAPGAESPAPMTCWGYVHRLRRAGFRNAQVFNVIPDHLHPQHLVSAERDASGAYFKNVIEDRRANISYPNYLFRRLLLWLNAFPYVERSYLVFAQK